MEDVVMWFLYVILDILVFIACFYTIAYGLKLDCKKSQITLEDVIKASDGLVFIGLIPFMNLLLLFIFGIYLLYNKFKNTKIL